MNEQSDVQVAADLAATLTWEPPDPGEWDFDGAHQTEPISAFGEHVAVPLMSEGCKSAFAVYGLPLSHLEMRTVNGYGYLSAFVHGAPRKGNGKAPPALLIKLLTRVPPSARRRLKVARAAVERDVAMSEVDRWDEMRPGWIARCLEVQDVEIASIADTDLADHLGDVSALFADGFRMHFELLSQVMPVGEYLVQIDAWGLDGKVAAKAAFHGVRTTIEANDRLDAIVAAIEGADADALDDLDAIRHHSVDAAAALDEYLRYHGSWLFADDIPNATLAEHPAVVLQTIRRHHQGGRHEQPEIEAAIDACRSAIAADHHATFDRLRSRAQRAYAALDDNSGLLAAWPGGLVHRAYVEAARRLVARGSLLAPDDAWTLVPDELANLLRGASEPSMNEIRDRVLLRTARSMVTPPSHLGSPPSLPPDPAWFPEPVGGLVAAFMAFLEAKFGAEEDEPLGVGERAGTGRAVVALTPSDALDRIEPGDVLVTTHTTPAFNVVMPLLGGVVTTTGGANGHTAIVARELSVPAVIGVSDALDRVPDGSMVTVDPVAATVTVIDEAAQP